MNKIKLIDLLSKTFIPIGCFLVIAIRIAQIWLNPVDDYDTSSFVLMVQGGFYPKTMFFFDIAHPGLLAGLINVCHLIQASTSLSPIYIWSTLITFGFLFAFVCLFQLMKALGCSFQLASLSCLFYSLSPSIADVAARSEENILFHGPFILAIWACISYVRRQSIKSIIFLLLSALLLSALHAQPFVIICGGLFLFLCSEFLKARNIIINNLNIALKVFAIFSITGFLYYFVMHYAFYNPMIVKAYSNNFYSLLHNDSYVRYLQAYLLFAQGFVLTGELPVNYATVTGVDPRTSIWLLGIIVLTFALYLTARRRLVDCFVLPALGFVFLYEPSASERWDTFAIALIISLVSRLAVIDNNKFPASKKYAWCLVAMLFVLNVFSLWGQVNQIFITLGAQNVIRNALDGTKVVFADTDSARSLISLSPRGIQLRNIESEKPLPGDAIYLKAGTFVAINKFNLNCQPTKVSGLCLIGN